MILFIECSIFTVCTRYMEKEWGDYGV